MGELRATYNHTTFLPQVLLGQYPMARYDYGMNMWGAENIEQSIRSLDAGEEDLPKLRFIQIVWFRV